VADAQAATGSAGRSPASAGGGPAATGGGPVPPLAGVRVLALEQYQSLPFATNILARLGAEVIKVELPPAGEMSRVSTPGLTDVTGRYHSGTFLRNNHNKRSLAIDWRTPKGSALVKRAAARCDVFAENFRPGALGKYGLSYEQLAEAAPRLIYASISGFGQDPGTPYFSRPAFATVVEAMSGFYSAASASDDPPVVGSAGALGDTVSGLYAAIGIMAALRSRDVNGVGQHLDIAMLDCMLGIQDFGLSQWCLRHEGTTSVGIVHAFRATDGWFVLNVNRHHQFMKLADVIGRPEWASDASLSSAQDWSDKMEDVIRPGIEAWSAGRTRSQACDVLTEAGLAAGPALTFGELSSDPHLALRHMLVDSGLKTRDGSPYLFPGDPIKLRQQPRRPDVFPPPLGRDGPGLLAELGLSETEVEALRQAGIIASTSLRQLVSRLAARLKWPPGYQPMSCIAATTCWNRASSAGSSGGGRTKPLTNPDKRRVTNAGSSSYVAAGCISSSTSSLTTEPSASQSPLRTRRRSSSCKPG
jgi:crotonobetainyl-CoA:carnitine CoA-transferase CaiB-like acyl-CoA transferase